MTKRHAALAALLLAAAASPDIASAQVPGFTPPFLQRPTFSAAAVNLQVPQTGAGDAACLVGSATRTIRVTRAKISGTDSTLQTSTVQLVKRTAASSGGTSTQPSIVSLDSALNNGGATAVVNAYTAIPTPGAGVSLKADSIAFNAATAASSTFLDYVFEPTSYLIQSVTLRGVAQQLCFYFPSAFTTAGPVVNVTFEWTEQ